MRTMTTIMGTRMILATVSLLLSAVAAASAQTDFMADGIARTIDGEPAALGISGDALLVAGTDSLPGNGQWRLERRSLASGALDPAFDGDGVINANPTFNWDVARGVATDGTHAYVVGSDGAGGFGVQRWRIEKRALTSGQLAGGFGSGGVITVEPSTGAGAATAIVLDGGDLLVAGDGWRVERRRSADGGLVSAFGAGGAVTGTGQANALGVASGAVYVGGTPNYDDWRVERRDAVTGAVVWGTSEDRPSVGCGGQGVFALAADAGGLYLGGASGGQWWLERRRLTDGAVVWTQALPGSGSCDRAVGLVLDGSVLYVAGSRGHSMRLEKRSTADGGLVSGFGAGGVVSGPAFDFADPVSLLLNGGLLYVAITEFGAQTGTWGRIERRRATDGALVPGAASSTTTTTVAPATTTTTSPPAGLCAPLRVEDCKTRVRFVGGSPARDAMSVRCVVRLDGASDGIAPPAEAIAFALTDADSSSCGGACFAQTVSPQRIGRCWKYKPAPSAPGLRSLKLCDVELLRGVYRLAARARRIDLQCLNAPPWTVDLTIGDDCTTECGGSPGSTTTSTVVTTTTIVGGTTTTIPAGGCHVVSAFPSTVINAPPATDDWLSPEDARTTDGRTALVRLSNNGPSSYLQAAGFGFGLPSSARIDGITLTVVRAARDGQIVDLAVRLVREGTVLPAERARQDAWTPFYTSVAYGGPTDTWGTTWSAAQVNAPDFGAAVRTAFTGFSGNDDAGVDSIMLSVSYCY